MHSSMMHTTDSSSHLGGGLHTLPDQTPWDQASPQDQATPWTRHPPRTRHPPPWDQTPQWTETLTHATENITLPKLRLQAVIISS